MSCIFFARRSSSSSRRSSSALTISSRALTFSFLISAGLAQTIVPQVSFGFLHLAGRVRGSFAFLGRILQHRERFGILGLAFLAQAVELVEKLPGAFGQLVLQFGALLELGRPARESGSPASRREAIALPSFRCLRAAGADLPARTGLPPSLRG